MKVEIVSINEMSDDEVRELVEDDQYVRDVSPAFMAVAALTFLVMMGGFGVLVIAASVWFFSRFTN